jgi:valyl-tRNA synthetase
MTTLKTKYDFKEVEENRYQTWLDHGYFKSGNTKRHHFAL